MTSILTNAGQNVIGDAVFDGTVEYAESVAVGTGTASPAVTDTALDTNVFEASTASSVVEKQQGSDPGEYTFQITLQGGTEVPGGTAITEIGLKTDADTLLYRETRSAITIEDGSRITIQFSIQPTN